MTNKQIEIETLEKELAELKNRLAQEKRSLKDTEEIIESAQSQLVAAKIYLRPEDTGYQEIEKNLKNYLEGKNNLEKEIQNLEDTITRKKAILLSLQPDSLFDRLLSGLSHLWSLFVEACRGIWAFFTGNAKATSEEEVSLTDNEPSEVEIEEYNCPSTNPNAGEPDPSTSPIIFSQPNNGGGAIIPLEKESHFAGQAVLPKKTVRFDLGN
ncbi:MAG: hypothetical protein RLZ35_1237 [Pseudomonadota bacterium]|jgi:hypothetical protein